MQPLYPFGAGRVPRWIREPNQSPLRTKSPSRKEGPSESSSPQSSGPLGTRDVGSQKGAFATIAGKQPAHVFLRISAKKFIGANCGVPKDQIVLVVSDLSEFQLCLNIARSRFSSPQLAFQFFCRVPY